MAAMDWDKNRRQERLRKWLQENSLRASFWVHPPNLSSAEIGSWAKKEIKNSLRDIEYRLGLNKDFIDSPDSRLVQKLQVLAVSIESKDSNVIFNNTVEASTIFNSMKDYSIERDILLKLRGIFDLLITMTQDMY